MLLDDLPKSGDLATESDVEQKFLYALLSSPQGLGFSPSEIKSKQYLAPSDIDKGAGKKVGYFPDYSVYLASLPIMVIEAKAPTEAVGAGYREAALYAHELNKRFPAGINPVSRVLASNGREVAYGDWDAEPTIATVDDLAVGMRALDDLRASLGRSVMVGRAKELRERLSPPHRFKALKYIGGPAKQNAALPPNRFAHELVPLLRAFVDPAASRTNPAIVAKAYCPTEETIRYDSVLEALLKDNLARRRYPAFTEVSTSRHDAPEFNTALQNAVDGPHDGSAMLLLIGGVGVGKSMFIDRYLSHLMPQAIRENSYSILVDFNDAPADLAHLDNWIITQVLKDLPGRNRIADFTDMSKLRRYFGAEIAQRQRGPYADLAKHQPAEFERRIADDLAGWVDDPVKLLNAAFRFYGGESGKLMIVIFDNADKRDRDQQLAIFQAVQHFRATHRGFCVLALRDETYDRYQNEPPLDAYLKTFSFRITPPRFTDVVRRRLELMIDDLTSGRLHGLSFKLPNGMAVHYPASDLGRYLLGTTGLSFSRTRQLRVVVEASAGRDVRIALQMFADVLMSAHLTDDRIFVGKYSSDGIDLPEWLAIRVLMRTKFQYFTEDHGYVCNVFEVHPESRTTSGLSAE